MGHCGSTRAGYESCQWKDLKCGKLVCEYPSNKPFTKENAAVIYARVHSRWFVTLDYMKGPQVKDPFLVADGASCGKDMACMNQKFVQHSVLSVTKCDPKVKCNGKGVCNNKGNCHCLAGWAPPDCKDEDKRGYGGSIDSSLKSGLKTWICLTIRGKFQMSNSPVLF
uniref:EGF-like domain-containing protein n=1 Tax=Sphenodon punctatus TaxID=8508 RepID=A0A8D0H0Y7_SPHPU